MTTRKVLLRPKEVGRKEVEYVKRPALYARECAHCKSLFEMRPWHYNDSGVGVLRGTFDHVALDDAERSLGNGFRAYICSFRCADALFRGGWRELPEYAPWADAGTKLARASLMITHHLVHPDDLIREWEQDEEGDLP